jgi:hypothetical protein
MFPTPMWAVRIILGAEEAHDQIESGRAEAPAAKVIDFRNSLFFIIIVL